MESEYHIRLKELPAEERPLERLEEHGPEALKTSELLAIIIRTGTGQATAVQVSEQLLKKYDGNLIRIKDETTQQLGKGVKGLGSVKAAQIKASFELGRRMASYYEEKYQISAPSDVARLMMSSVRDLKQEVLYVLCLDTKQNVIKRRQIFEGSLNASIIHPREVFRFAIEEAAAAILLVHNHPSGDPAPSKEDIRATKELIAAGNHIQIPVLDHIIIGDGIYTSLKEEGAI